MPADANVVVTANYLLYLQNGTLMAQSFDTKRAELKEEPTPVAEKRDTQRWYLEGRV